MPPTFVSYASPYDSYVGTRNWNDLTLDQRRMIAQAEFEGRDIDINEYVMTTGLKKSQLGGIRALYVAARMFNERIGLVKEGVTPVEVRKHVLSVFANTRFFREMNSLLNGTAAETTDYVGVELERLAQTNRAPSPLEEALTLDVRSARRFIQGQLEVLHRLPQMDPAAARAPAEERAPALSEEMPPPRPTRHRKRSILEWFSCDEVRWIKDEVFAFFGRHHYLVEGEALRQCMKVASDSDKGKYSIRVDQMKPDEVALLIIRNVALNEVAYGSRHVYRSTLGQVGKEFERMFIDAVNESVTRGYTNEKEAADDIAEMRAAVRSAG